jgi:hypothetical protein
MQADLGRQLPGQAAPRWVRQLSPTFLPRFLRHPDDPVDRSRAEPPESGRELPGFVQPLPQTNHLARA